ncbi:MAG: hypothetical protein ACRDIY_17785 [Chloroflexota bacterium]
MALHLAVPFRRPSPSLLLPRDHVQWLGWGNDHPRHPTGCRIHELERAGNPKTRIGRRQLGDDELPRRRDDDPLAARFAGVGEARFRRYQDPYRRGRGRGGVQRCSPLESRSNQSMPVLFSPW